MFAPDIPEKRPLRSEIRVLEAMPLREHHVCVSSMHTPPHAVSFQLAPNQNKQEKRHIFRKEVHVDCFTARCISLFTTTNLSHFTTHPSPTLSISSFLGDHQRSASLSSINISHTRLSARHSALSRQDTTKLRRITRSYYLLIYSSTDIDQSLHAPYLPQGSPSPKQNKTVAAVYSEYSEHGNYKQVSLHLIIIHIDGRAKTSANSKTPTTQCATLYLPAKTVSFDQKKKKMPPC